MSRYMQEQALFFPGRDHWDRVFAAIVTELSDIRYR